LPITPKKPKIKAKKLRPPRVKKGKKGKNGKPVAVEESGDVEVVVTVAPVEHVEPVMPIEPVAPEGEVVEPVGDVAEPVVVAPPVAVEAAPVLDEADKERIKAARRAAREILFAFVDMGDVLTQTHVEVLREVEGLRPNKEPVAVEVLAREVGVAPVLLWEHLEQAADFLTQRVSEFGGVDVAPADMAVALRVYEQGDENDRALTALWLDKGSEDAAAAVSDFSPEEIKKARMRVIKRMGDVLVDKIDVQ
jgi:hypothetical protein